MENPIKMDNLGVPLFLETPYIWLVVFLHPSEKYAQVKIDHFRYEGLQKKFWNHHTGFSFTLEVKQRLLKWQSLPIFGWWKIPKPTKNSRLGEVPYVFLWRVDLGTPLVKTYTHLVVMEQNHKTKWISRRILQHYISIHFKKKKI